jgi:hypothetical protein
MLKLDRKFLQDVGLGRLAPGPASLVHAYLAVELESRVARRLAAGLSDEELAEFEAIGRSGDDTASLAWLHETRPHYREIVWVELLRLRREVGVQVALVDRSLPGLPHAYSASFN